MKILNKLTIKHLTSNKRRTIVTIIGIILSTALMVGIGLLFSTMRENAIAQIIKSNGSYHAMVKMPRDKLNLLDNNIKKYDYASILGYSLLDGITNEYKPYVEVLSVDNDYLNNLNLTEGRLPNNGDEIVISRHLITNGEVDLKIDDTLKLNIGNRVDGLGNLIDETSYQEGESLINTNYKEYKIVGIVERNVLENYQNPGYNIYTINSDSNNLKVYITYKKVKDTYKNTEKLASDLGYKNLGGDDYTYYNEISYNDSLLYLYGVSSYGNVLKSMSSFLAIILSIISIACIIVIYNSFAISVMERKKQFGLFASIGATRKQLKHTVFYEAFIVGFIGIILGIIASFIGIGCVIAIINYLIPTIFDEPLKLIAYPLFIIIPVIFMINYLISAYLPAKRASKVTPIEAIRQNDDIKIKNKKLKTPKMIYKLFGIEGDIAYKNMKRNKKKYRITIISLFISVVLFISFSAIVKYGLETAYDFTGYGDYDFMINVNNNSQNKINTIEDDIKKYEYTDYLSYYSMYFTTNDSISYSDEYLNSNQYSNNEGNMGVDIITLDENSYNKYKKEMGLKEDVPILLNQYETIDYTHNSRKKIKIQPFNNINSLNLLDFDGNNIYNFNNLYLTNILPKGISTSQPSYSLTIIVSKNIFNEIINKANKSSNNVDNNEYSYSLNIYLNANNYDELEKYLDTYKNNGIYYYNVKEEMKTMYNSILVIKILLYGFISLVTLIGVTSVLNTINTSIALRRKEFAMLRSMGLTPKGFNRMLFFESLFFGLKALLYGIPVSLIITYLLYNTSSEVVELDNILIPWESIFVAIIGVFIIVLISMWYASRKIKKENILEALREENI